MILKRLLEILRTFDKAELKRFGKLVSSGFFNTNRSVDKLFRAIARQNPEFKEEKLGFESLFRNVYENRKYDEKTFRYLITELSQLAERYLVLNEYEKAPVKEKLILSEALLNRRLFTQAARTMRALDKDLGDNNTFSLDLIQKKMELNILWNDLSVSLDKQEPMMDKRTEQTELLIYYSVVELSNMLNVLVGIKKLYNLEYDETVIKPYFEGIDYKGILEALDKKDQEVKKRNGLRYAFKAYLCYMITFLDPYDEKYFYRLKEIVTKNADLFSREELFNLHTSIGSCCSLKRETIDDVKYLKEHFEIEKSSLKAGLLTHSEEQYMQVNGFLLLFRTSLELGDIKWAETFAAEYEHMLSPEIRDSVSHYADACLLFENGNYTASIGKLNKVKFPIQGLKLLVRETLLKNFYELGYFEEAFSLVDSFTHLLKSNRKLNPGTKDRYLNFLDLTKKLLNLITRTESKLGAERLEEMIIKSRVLTSKKWLLLKAGQLKK